MDKLITIAVSIVLLTSSSLFIFRDSLFSDDESQQNAVAKRQAPTLSSVPAKPQNIPHQGASRTVSARGASEKETEILPPPLKLTPNETIPWQPQESIPSTYAALENEPVERAYLKVNPDALSAIDVGDEFELYIPQVNENFQVNADGVEYHSNGDKTITGQVLDQYGEGYPVTVTVGENGTFANISTPKGGFVMESDNQDGWIASTVDIHNLQDFSKPDYVVPKEPKTLLPIRSN